MKQKTVKARMTMRGRKKRTPDAVVPTPFHTTVKAELYQRAADDNVTHAKQTQNRARYLKVKAKAKVKKALLAQLEGLMAAHGIEGDPKEVLKHLDPWVLDWSDPQVQAAVVEGGTLRKASADLLREDPPAVAKAKAVQYRKIQRRMAGWGAEAFLKNAGFKSAFFRRK